VGDTLDYTVSLSNDKFLPLIWVEMRDAFPEGLALPGARLRGSGVELVNQHSISASLLPYQRASWKYSLKCEARGLYRIGPVRLRSGDIFGFSSSEISPPQVAELLVYPRVVDLRRLLLPASHPLGDAKGRQPIHHDPARFLALRDYHPADPMKHIDWKATARRSRLQTKVFEPVVSLNVLIALNAATSEHCWEGINRRLFERAVVIAASAAKYVAEQKCTFGLVSNAVAMYSGRWISVPFGRSPDQLALVMEALATAGPYVVTSLVEVLRAERSSLPPGATVVLVTAVVTPSLAQEMAEIRAKGYQVVLLFAGDGAPGQTVPGVATYHAGQALQGLEEHEPVLA